LVAVLTGGDDYEILFTAPPVAAEPLRDLARELTVPVTSIGRVTAATTESDGRVSMLNAMGEPLLFGADGWTHF
jgi:thiamine-monophosphate kinase